MMVPKGERQTQSHANTSSASAVLCVTCVVLHPRHAPDALGSHGQGHGGRNQVGGLWAPWRKMGERKGSASERRPTIREAMSGSAVAKKVALNSSDGCASARERGAMDMHRHGGRAYAWAWWAWWTWTCIGMVDVRIRGHGGHGGHGRA